MLFLRHRATRPLYRMVRCGDRGNRPPGVGAYRVGPRRSAGGSGDGRDLGGVFPRVRLRPLPCSGRLLSRKTCDRFAERTKRLLACHERPRDREKHKEVMLLYISRTTSLPSAASPHRATPEDSKRGTKSGDILFHGPYWFLQKGVWRFKLHGAVRGAIFFILQERFGYHVLDSSMREGQSEHIFILKRDLIHFECVARSATESAQIELDRLEFVREA
jgi:hypothetical protein